MIGENFTYITRNASFEFRAMKSKIAEDAEAE
jgi:hypothetical protein